MQSAYVFLLLVASVGALRCYDYLSNNNLVNPLHTWVDCPYDTRFCYKSFIENYNLDGSRTYVENRSCGTPMLCHQEGCIGEHRDRACCCKKDLCNGAMATSIPIIITGAVAFLFH